MGNFNINVDAVGGHGCSRDVKDGEVVAIGCGQPGCPDCLARKFVAELKAQGQIVNSARLTHWPGEKGQVIDDLLSGIREGSFS